MHLHENEVDLQFLQPLGWRSFRWRLLFLDCCRGGLCLGCCYCVFLLFVRVCVCLRVCVCVCVCVVWVYVCVSFRHHKKCLRKIQIKRMTTLETRYWIDLCNCRVVKTLKRKKSIKNSILTMGVQYGILSWVKPWKLNCKLLKTSVYAFGWSSRLLDI